MAKKHTLRLEKVSERRLDPAVMRKQIQYVAQRALSGNRGKVWAQVGKSTPDHQEDAGVHLYTVSLSFQRIGREVPPATVQSQWEVIQDMAEKAGRGKGWGLPQEGPPQAQERAKPSEPAQPPPKVFAPLERPRNGDFSQHFAHLYDRESQIAVVRSALEAFLESNHQDRYHAVLHGPPACLHGKTMIHDPIKGDTVSVQDRWKSGRFSM